MNICSMCKESLPVTSFHKKNANKNKLASWCKKCCSSYKKQKRKKNRDEINKQKREEYLNNIEEHRVRKKNTYKRHKDQIKARMKKYYENNKERILKRNSIYHKEYEKKKKEIDPVYKLKKQLRALMYNSLRNQGYTKKSKTYEILGTDRDTVLEYFRKLWKDRYNEELPDKYDIHHIIPCHTARTEDELIKLQHYMNLEPLKREDHLRKHFSNADNKNDYNISYNNEEENYETK